MIKLLCLNLKCGCVPVSIVSTVSAGVKESNSIPSEEDTALAASTGVGNTLYPMQTSLQIAYEQVCN